MYEAGGMAPNMKYKITIQWDDGRCDFEYTPSDQQLVQDHDLVLGGRKFWGKQPPAR
jgi:hypothetical protein